MAEAGGAPAPAGADEAESTARQTVMVAGAASGLVACILGAVAILLIVRQDTQTSGLVIGLLVSVAGYFGTALQQAYGFEFGSSRSAANKEKQMAAVTGSLVAHATGGAQQDGGAQQ